MVKFIASSIILVIKWCVASFSFVNCSGKNWWWNAWHQPTYVWQSSLEYLPKTVWLGVSQLGVHLMEYKGQVCWCSMNSKTQQFWMRGALQYVVIVLSYRKLDWNRSKVFVLLKVYLSFLRAVCKCTCTRPIRCTKAEHWGYEYGQVRATTSEISLFPSNDNA